MIILYLFYWTFLGTAMVTEFCIIHLIFLTHFPFVPLLTSFRRAIYFCNWQKYYLCCCRLSQQELLDQQEQHETLNDFIFEVEGNEDTARLNNVSHVSELTNDEDAFRSEARLPLEVISIRSVFPDLLGEEMEKEQQHHQQQRQQPNTSTSLQEPLIPRQRN